MIGLLLAFALTAQAQSTFTAVDDGESIRLRNVSLDVRELQSGYPTISGKPTYQNGFCFGDGTCQTTAPTASAGISSTQTYTIFFASGPTAASSTTIHGLDFTTYNYRLEVTLTDASNAGYRFRCADDTGNNYEVGGFIANNAGSASFGYRPGSCVTLSYDTSCGATNRVLANKGFHGEYLLTQDQGVSNAVQITGQGGYLNDSSQRENSTISGVYLGSGSVTKCAVYPGAGSITGTVKVWRIAR